MKRTNGTVNFFASCLVSGIVSLLQVTLSSAQTVSFSPATNVAVGGTSVGLSTVAVAVGDVNEDGKLDLAVANGNGNTVSLLLGAGDGAFGAATDVTVGTTPLAVAIADFNKDGKQDLAVANSNSNTVSLLLGAGDGAFGAATNVTVTNPTSLTVGDFNGDGNPDLAVTQGGIHLLSILLGNGAGAFAGAASYDLGPFQRPESVVAADFNGDGNLDLAVANPVGTGTLSPHDNIFILLGAGNGSFGPATNVAVGITPESLTVGDFNGDGKPDLAVANEFSFDVSILLGKGDGTFDAAPNVPVENNPQSVAVGDFNGDGRLDLAVTRPGSSDVLILLGTGDGTFGTATTFSVQVGPFSLAVGDFNGDGQPDLAVTKLGSNTVSILLNTTVIVTPPPPAYAAYVQQPINADGSSVFNMKRGVVPVKFTLTLNGVSTCSLPTATIAVFRIASSVNQPISESIYSIAADNGSYFRIDSCQYVYNVAVSALGPGSYLMQILIDDTPVGGATFGLK